MAEEKPNAYQKPKTIRELQEFCREKNMPLERMRFFIGADTPEAKAFGICRTDDGNFLVYKNKSDGSRAVRYLGPDEAFAVNEIYEKLKSETQMRREGYTPGKWSEEGDSPAGSIDRTDANVHLAKRKISQKGVTLTIVGLLAAFGIYGAIFIPDNGYYHYNNNDYYYYSGDWYAYDAGTASWLYTEGVDEELTSHYSDYFLSDEYDYDADYPDFSTTDYWYDYYSDDDDYDWDWGSDSGWDDWDYSDTDWDSDW